MEKINIGYLSSLKIEDQYIGGLLVTDIRAVPMEFKYTDPIQPTDNQKLMYGEVLDKTIHEEVIRVNLLRAVKKVPSIILVSDTKLLGEDAINNTPIVAIEKTTLDSIGEAGEYKRINKDEIIIQSNAEKNPLKIIFFSLEPDVQKKVKDIFKKLVDTINIYEPFLRVEKGLKHLCQGKN